MTKKKPNPFLGKTLASALAVLLAFAYVADFEGGVTKHGARAYQDVVGVWTICYGHTDGVRAGQTATKQECEDLLIEDLFLYNDYINRCIYTPLEVHEQAAILSATYNLGPRFACNSTMQRLLNHGDKYGACMQFHRWNRAGGRVLNGLVERRDEESNQCLNGHWTFDRVKARHWQQLIEAQLEVAP